MSAQQKIADRISKLNVPVMMNFRCEFNSAISANGEIAEKWQLRLKGNFDVMVEKASAKQAWRSFISMVGGNIELQQWDYPIPSDENGAFMLIKTVSTKLSEWNGDYEYEKMAYGIVMPLLRGIMTAATHKLLKLTPELDKALDELPM